MGKYFSDIELGDNEILNCSEVDCIFEIYHCKY